VEVSVQPRALVAPPPPWKVLLLQTAGRVGPRRDGMDVSEKRRVEVPGFTRSVNEVFILL